MDEATALGAEEVGCRNSNVVERLLRRVLAGETHFVEFSAAGESSHPAFDDKKAETV
ncbi:hypothetical protein DEU38_1109 [Rhodococcus sp. AG1013]|nr:hypothetical protein DEU38_1109 [Rhodococcus sp. AG1013]